MASQSERFIPRNHALRGVLPVARDETLPVVPPRLPAFRWKSGRSLSGQSAAMRSERLGVIGLRRSRLRADALESAGRPRMAN